MVVGSRFLPCRDLIDRNCRTTFYADCFAPKGDALGDFARQQLQVELVHLGGVEDRRRLAKPVDDEGIVFGVGVVEVLAEAVGYVKAILNHARGAGGLFQGPTERAAVAGHGNVVDDDDLHSEVFAGADRPEPRRNLFDSRRLDGLRSQKLTFGVRDGTEPRLSKELPLPLGKVQADIELGADSAEFALAFFAAPLEDGGHPLEQNLWRQRRAVEAVFVVDFPEPFHGVAINRRSNKF
mmetsp:Transcript_16581/g.53994  ORF Transcript_16581/g.53994 Transcript_16581/m.53994 type:complete len:238 (-) Transcript_16581:1690-2403(-)